MHTRRTMILAVVLTACGDEGRPTPLPLPPPPPDMVLIKEGLFIGQDKECHDGTLQPKYDYGTDTEHVELGTVRFRVDRRVVSCGDYDRCIVAGGCDRKAYVRDNPTGMDPRCVDGVIAVKREAAIAYCAWRGALLPTSFEWQRAIRGDQAWKYPRGNKSLPEYRRHDGALGTTYVSPVGVEYHWNGDRDFDHEWTRDNDCFLHYANSGVQPTLDPVLGRTDSSLGMSWGSLDSVSPFRCVIEL